MAGQAGRDLEPGRSGRLDQGKPTGQPEATEVRPHTAPWVQFCVARFIQGQSRRTPLLERARARSNANRPPEQSPRLLATLAPSRLYHTPGHSKLRTVILNNQPPLRARLTVPLLPDFERVSAVFEQIQLD